MDEERPWTLAEGARDVARFVGRRAIGGVPVWIGLAFGLAYFSNLGSVAGDVSRFMIVMALVSLVLGMPVGMIYARGLPDAVDLAGWIPWSIASGASVLTVVGGTLLVDWVTPFESAFYEALVSTMASIGAVAQVTRCTWAEE